MRQLSVIEYEDETIIETYNPLTKKRVEYSFESWYEAIEAVEQLDEA